MGQAPRYQGLDRSRREEELILRRFSCFIAKQAVNAAGKQHLCAVHSMLLPLHENVELLKLLQTPPGGNAAGRRLPYLVSGLALSGAIAPAPPKGEPLAIHSYVEMKPPEPLPLGEVAMRSIDGEGELTDGEDVFA